MPPTRNDGKTFQENQPGIYIYDPMFCIHGDEEEDGDPVVQLPFQSYTSQQTNTYKERSQKEITGKVVTEEKSKTRSQNKTPRSMMKMMERHRENERVRHHTLNKSMKKVCDRVPGSSPFIKETKVVMMQRIIAYICYLENTISFLCSNLGIKQLKMSTNFVTDQCSSVSDQDKKKEDVIIIQRKIQPKANKRQLIEKRQISSPTIDSTEKRRLKISSPTIDSTTDNVYPSVSNEVIVDSQDSQGVSSTYKYNDDIFLDENACCVPEHYEETYLNDEFLPSSTNLDSFPDAFDMMSSPLANLPVIKTEAMNEETENSPLRTISPENSPLRTISPDCILPQSSSEYLITPTKYRNKRKQTIPKRSPFSNITNMSPRKRQAKKWMKTDSKFSKECPVDEDFVSYVPYIWKFHKSAASRRKKMETENIAPVQSGTADSRVEKIDHRKTTWMNGFMMFSRLNRRSFIEANPGVHTSYISKMMGHAWRQMTSDDQFPYREQAKDYASTMKDMVCDETSLSDIDL